MDLNKKISNVDSLSALIDRLVAERIKLYFFEKDHNAIGVAHQNDVLLQLKVRIADCLQECLIEHDYDVLNERRTFSLNDITQEIVNLTHNDIMVGENDRLALHGLQTDNVEEMKSGIVGFRTANEQRAKSKNLLDTLFQKLFKK